MSLHDPGCNTHAGSWLAHARLGYNYRLSEINCALGIAQMERLDEMLDMRRNVAQMYFQRLMGFKDLILPNLHENETRSWFVFVVRLSDLYGGTERDRVVQGLRRHDVGAANYFPCIHLQPFYKKRFGYDKGMLPIAESVSQRTIALPFFNRMDETHVELATHTLYVMLQREQLLMQKDAS